MRKACGFVAIAVLCTCVASAQAEITISTVQVDNMGNAPDTRYATPGFGGVDYMYYIGSTEVTAGQYTAFLNSVAATDTYGLYNANMWSQEKGCKIQQTGSPGSYIYSVAEDFANRPVNYVGWGDAVRFCNWLHNGQPTGSQDLSTTEDGSYFLNGASTQSQLMGVVREADATWALPTEDQWYKAAYHKNDGVTGNYWVFPTSTDAQPGNLLVDPDPGNNANIKVGSSSTLGAPYFRTLVGDFENSFSPYGTFDQGGNLSEWDETAFSTTNRVIRGGSFFNTYTETRAQARASNNPTVEGIYVGFRVSNVIPEPFTLGLLAVGLLAILRRR